MANLKPMDRTDLPPDEFEAASFYLRLASDVEKKPGAPAKLFCLEIENSIKGSASPLHALIFRIFATYTPHWLARGVEDALSADELDITQNVRLNLALALKNASTSKKADSKAKARNVLLVLALAHFSRMGLPIHGQSGGESSSSGNMASAVSMALAEANNCNLTEALISKAWQSREKLLRDLGLPQKAIENIFAARPPEEYQK